MPSAILKTLHRQAAALASPQRAAANARFFKTGPGEYGEGDRFLGLTVPQVRKLARDARDLGVRDAFALLRSPLHEERLIALVILVDLHRQGTEAERRAIHREYLANVRYVNNWDLVDTSAGEIVGTHVARRGTAFLERLARSPLVWERRVAMIATFHDIRRGELRPALLIAERLLGDDHDLIHKAVGWMLREVGKQDVGTLRAFLERHAATMPRTTLRYAIERLPAAERKDWLGRRALMARSATTSSPRSRRSRA